MEDKKYPKSIKGRQCIGPCYEKGKWVIHPVTLKTAVNTLYPFCPIDETVEKTTDGKNVKVYFDQCYMPTETTDKQLEMDMLIPKRDFRCENFLEIYYNIFSLEDLFKWLYEHSNKPLGSRMRVVNCGWEVFWNSMEILDDRFINFYIELIKKKWIKYVYNTIDKNINIKNKKIFIEKNNGSSSNKVEKINFFLKKYITNNNVYKILINYHDEHMDDFKKIDNHNDEIREYFIKYVDNLF